mgnify:CR=1 FL=1
MKTLRGNEPVTFEGKSIGRTLIDFWKWNSSDLLNNTLRGALAEFIVASSLNIDISECREDWLSVDLLWKTSKLSNHSEIKIEVKCSGYLQSYYQKTTQSLYIVLHLRAFILMMNKNMTMK